MLITSLTATPLHKNWRQFPRSFVTLTNFPDKPLPSTFSFAQQWCRFKLWGARPSSFRRPVARPAHRKRRGPNFFPTHQPTGEDCESGLRFYILRTDDPTSPHPPPPPLESSRSAPRDGRTISPVPRRLEEFYKVHSNPVSSGSRFPFASIVRVPFATLFPQTATTHCDAVPRRI